MKYIACILCVGALTSHCFISADTERTLTVAESIRVIGGDENHKACAHTDWGSGNGFSPDPCAPDGSYCASFGTECSQGHQEEAIQGTFWKCRPTVLESTCNPGYDAPCLVSYICTFEPITGECIPDISVSPSTIGTAAESCETPGGS